MAAYDLKQMLAYLNAHPVVPGTQFDLPSRYCAPGVWVTLAALASKHGLLFAQLSFKNAGSKEYAKAIKLEQVLSTDGTDSYEHERKNAGLNYSPITALNCPELVDVANSAICGCLRRLGDADAPGMQDLCKVVGELHDNVWSHGKDTGFSMAQKVKVGDDYYIEFALADTGMGLKQEMERARRRVDSHQAAIEWCFQEGHSTKLADDDDDWAQALPADHIGSSPFGPNIATKEAEGNHHQGLGLAKLMKLVRGYGGRLIFATGDSVLTVKEDGKELYSRLQREWKGVAISCRLRASALAKGANGAEDGPELDYIMQRLKGGG